MERDIYREKHDRGLECITAPITDIYSRFYQYSPLHISLSYFQSLLYIKNLVEVLGGKV